MMRFARWVFLVAGLVGILQIVPPYFLEAQVGRDYPPPVTHPENYYGFLGVCLAWQLMFLVIAWDPLRFRMAMLPAMVEKLSFSLAIFVLYALGRVPPVLVGFASLDSLWLVLFGVAYLWTSGCEEKSV